MRSLGVREVVCVLSWVGASCGDEPLPDFAAGGPRGPGQQGAELNRDAATALTCEQQTSASSLQLREVLERADKRCLMDSDCTRVALLTACHDGCSALVSKVGAEAVLRAAAAQSEPGGACAGFVERGCVRIAPPCVSPEPFTCIDGSCQPVPR
jgi:hypothetical protein